ncbi:Conserved_hypothetical protein [Hexamita inflata]|uniref:Tyrosine-protein kinase ephrin type A/B receptor-like domain-containing protein n=1 Tax=Hexamita inflata TaxID=28002 RepID=A0AA86QDZ6_9EUKA|nr:Conserved hypothetical protein [Hexamita inflata]
MNVSATRLLPEFECLWSSDLFQVPVWSYSDIYKTCAVQLKFYSSGKTPAPLVYPTPIQIIMNVSATRSYLVVLGFVCGWVFVLCKFYSSGNNTCTSCLSNSHLDNNECVCDSDSYLSSNTSGVLTCFKCPSGATPDNTNKTCTCPANKFYSSGNNTCTSCLSNSTLVNNECVCDSDSYLSSNTSGVLTCFKCPSGATPDNTNKTCTCPANKFYSSGNNTCTSCLSNSTLVNNECVCDSDSYLSSNTSGVLTCFKCPSGATPDNTNKTCTCPANKFYSSGNNTCTSCLSNSTLVNNECVCDSDSYLSSNTSGVLTCFKCPSGATPDNTNKTCTCPANKFYSSGNNTCTSCLSNSTLVNNECVCDSDSYLSSNTSGVLTCFKCPSGATPDNTNKTCTCPANKFYSSGNNTCTSCLSNSTLVNNECVCDSDSYLSSNTSGVLTCFKCPSGATPDNTNKTCTCPANQFYSSDNNTCTSCLSNSTLVNNECVCDSDSYLSSNTSGVLTCFKCPSGATPDNTNKTCTCPANKFYSLFWVCVCVWVVLCLCVLLVVCFFWFCVCGCFGCFGFVFVLGVLCLCVFCCLFFCLCVGVWLFWVCVCVGLFCVCVFCWLFVFFGFVCVVFGCFWSSDLFQVPSGATPIILIRPVLVQHSSTRLQQHLHLLFIQLYLGQQ